MPGKMTIKPYRANQLARQCLRLPGGYRLKRARLVKKRVKHVARILATCQTCPELYGIMPPSPLFTF